MTRIRQSTAEDRLTRMHNEAAMTHVQRATVEGTLARICEHLPLHTGHWNTMTRLLDHPRRRGQDVLELVPLRIWRAFYRRHPGRMHGALRRSVQELAQQFKAEDASSTAIRAIDDVLATLK